MPFENPDDARFELRRACSLQDQVCKMELPFSDSAMCPPRPEYVEAAITSLERAVVRWVKEAVEQYETVDAE